MSLRNFVLAVTVALGLAAVGQAGPVLFSETLTGAQLYSDPRVTFPTRTPAVQGTALLFDTGSLPLEKLLVWNLLPQNALNPAEPVTVHILANFTVRTSTWPTYPSDYDPGVGVGAGNVFGGIIAGDNDGGETDAVLYQDTGSVGQPAYYQQLFTGAGFPGTGQAYTAETTITLTATGTDIQGTLGSKTGSHTFAAPLDLNAPLNFVFFAHDAEERYQLNWVSVEVQGTLAVPEPTSIALLGMAGVALAGYGCAGRARTTRPAPGCRPLP